MHSSTTPVSLPLPSEVSVRITVRRPPPGVAFAIQRGRAELLEPSRRSADAVIFDFTVRVSRTATGRPPLLLGPFVQGPSGGRFVYVNSGTRAAQPLSPWNCRAKIPLAGISTAMIDAGTHVPGSRIETEFDGTAKDGGPTRATVKTIVWRLVEPPAPTHKRSSER